VRVLSLPAGNPGPYTGAAGNTTYLIDGAAPVLVDAGIGRGDHLDAVARELAGRSLARVVVTHGHSDHASGVEAIVARWPTAILLKRPWPEVDSQYRVDWTRLDDGSEVHTGAVVLRVVATPGHAPDHICLFEPESRTLFGGDLLAAHTTVVIPHTQHGSVRDYLASLRRVRGLAPARVLPAHGPAIEHPVALIDRYLDHRLQRERQILEVLQGGPATPARIVELVYESLRPELVGAAQESVLAHLFKLQEEGRVVRRLGSGKWEVTSEK